MPVTEPQILLAIDMDGTLLRDDKSVAPVDADAIRTAAQHGIAVTLATGRLVTGTLPVARELGLAHPLICGDGGLLVDPDDASILDRRAIAIADAAATVQALEAHDLTPYVFLPESIHCDEAGLRYRALVDTWSRELIVHDSLSDATGWRRPEGVVLTVGIGEESDVVTAYQHLAGTQAHVLDTVYFSMRGVAEFAVRSLPRGCDKAYMLDRLARRMGVMRDRVAVIGDWFNDLGMFAYAGRSFAMGQAPDTVKASATDVLRATSEQGGGVAEAIDLLIQSRPAP